MSEDHVSWLASQMSISPVTLWVDSPEEQGSGFSKYVTYSLCQPNKSVRHRYSLPKKTVVMKGASFHFQRMRGLQLFCEKVAANPYLRMDQAWLDFLEEGKAVIVEKNPLPDPHPMWMKAVEANETPSNGNEMVAKFKAESTKCDQQITAMIAKTKALIASYNSLAASTTDLAAAAVSFSEVETNEIDSLNSLSAKELADGAAASSVPNVLARVSTMFSTQLSSYTTAPDALNLLLVESLEYESSQMLDFHSMSKHVEKLAGDNDRNEKNLNSLRNKNTAKMTEEKIQKHNEAIEAAEKLLESSKAHCDRYIRALTTLTLPDLITSRRERIKVLALHLGAVIKSVSASTLSSADNFFKAMDSSGESAINSGSIVLEALSLPPLPEPSVESGGGSAVRVKSNSVQAERTSSHVNSDVPPPPGGVIEGQEV
ncbi:hypothetical protein TL16_g09540 [Triparma laevis f. inornata]|uniref:PX domain-containing protein n=1 Tax=Triparma laevis f. inornata TaxID=1714386 RepID=A0A9W7B3G2_9STRA|nr:hypothetical protein TL16_g09540 [Triparma laevis f. inornata]